MTGREDLDDFQVFFVVATFFIGLAIVALSGLSGQFLGILPGVLIMIYAYWYEQRSIRLKGGT